ncbi:LOW QUALITY PROTEIN: rho GTPase-activating protein 20-like [Polyodon spathula]|uniref:LOW QUALITY PROTEIN: rho GTPase-activating protein 20-like n=1 Tax=Polyodon spathula TaxID=7913 RepID=UPI001B7ECCAA|nr:LOW QUALITY PROTEIN: rho GTPase-activating protein 20-like [Polyodon spathula]
MEMSPQQDSIGQNRSSSLTGESKISGLPAEAKKKWKTLAQRRQSAPSLVISTALKSRTISRESCLSPVNPEACPLVQSFICLNRVFVMHGHVQLKTGLQTQERHLFLFSDILVIAKSKSTSQFKLKNHVRICEMWTASCTDEVCEGSTNHNQSFVMGWPTTNCVATFSSVEQKEKWLSFIKSRITEEKEKDDPKSIPLKLLARDVGHGAYTLSVGNTDTAADAIKMALQQFGITGCVKDYQLWVSSGKEDAPYPLIGHEYPFSIKMSHMRGPHAQLPVGIKDTAFPQDLKRTLLLQQLPLETQCQFILKPRCLAASQQLTGPSQKSSKRKRSIINWAFWRGSGTQLDSMPLSPNPPTPGRLFGLPLQSICEGDKLPKPVMDMLGFLFQEGPFTRGIFRRSANAKACRELRDKLNLGAEVLVACESVFVTAAVLKDFLRNIPGSILCVDFYEKWVNVIDKESHEEKIQVVQRLMEQLPKTNVLLLRYLFGVLHCIEQQSEENRMNAFNLAVCIAPSMLWPPSTSSPETESEVTKKISMLVQFIIENCSKIFREDIDSVFASMPRKSISGDHGSDVSSSQMNGSSYDSLENELNYDVDSPFSDLQHKRGQDNRSRDSVITLSDCDLDQPENENIHLQLPPLSRTRKFSPEAHQNRPHGEYLEMDLLCPVGLRRHRRCSEPTIGLQPSNFDQHFEQHEVITRKASYDAVLTNNEEDYIKQLRTLQLKGQELIKRSLNMVIELGNPSPSSPSDDGKDLQKTSRLNLKQPPPLRLNLCSTTCSSSLSSPGTSLSRSSMSSLDSAFSQYSDYTVFAPTEPCVCSESLTLKSQGDCSPRSLTIKQLSHQLSPSQHSDLTMCSSPKPEQSKLAGSLKESHELVSQRSPLTLHSNRWMKRTTPSMRSWSFRKKESRSKNGEKNESPARSPVSDKPKPPAGTVCQESKRQARLASVPKKTANETNIKQHCPPSYQEAIHQMQQNPFYQDVPKEEGLTVKTLRLLHESEGSKAGKKQVHSSSPATLKLDKRLPAGNSHIPQTVFYGQSACLGVYPMRGQQSFILAEDRPKSLAAHRCSEPEVYFAAGDWTSSLENRQRLAGQESNSITAESSQDVKCKISNTDPHCNDMESVSCKVEPKFCLSQTATKAVREYFLQTDVENCLQKTQEVTNGVIQSKKKWQNNQCSDPKFEDFDQMFFAEESYV